MMKVSLKATALIVLLLLSMVPPVFADAEKKEPSKIDLNLTLDYIKEWAGRNKFPESVSFAYYNAYCLTVLEKKIDAGTRKKIIDYITKCRTGSGGFVSEPEYTKDPDLLSTFYALKTLDLLKAAKTIDQDKTLKFVLSLAQGDGSFKADPKRDYSSLATTYYGVTCLHLLGGLDRIDKEKTVAYVLSYREKDRGFCVQRNTISRPVSTYMAVRSLKLLGALDPEIKPGVVRYLKQERYSGLVSGKKYTMQPTMQELSLFLEALSDLSAVKEVNREKIYEFIASLYVPENGGFGPKPGYGTTPPSIYQGIVCLERLGRLQGLLKGDEP